MQAEAQVIGPVSPIIVDEDMRMAIPATCLSSPMQSSAAAPSPKCLYAHLSSHTFHPAHSSVPFPISRTQLLKELITSGVYLRWMIMKEREAKIIITKRVIPEQALRLCCKIAQRVQPGMYQAQPVRQDLRIRTVQDSRTRGLSPSWLANEIVHPS